ncbi:multicomponent Na+:H+ antiporter subunit E [Clostridium tetanomorphum]|uniref:Na+/H+ antiporter subunit E n=1 Tax=Clostridium tetanomorphum TaxID=1553 RepID=A0A923E7S7_CLOTT|nr:Na+/H+ antiporter subunit E [Clostridium tetanomorphum]KAJ53364.1 cation antiporter [Clostridium tetanomorphum DSM 665]MBC2396649.1 Na+/H+ antiporter subunit E [Clostridium tetanomorphum]MBP1863980.1 multicomponent Na+:H+ antiporter subunit E [Clostridium tetanomorphum]NRS85058.1 multicomponent Na+:H+ antiporter subunit E [Clostridium tetanomorphum]NRZ98275.1 multicomponent Na+:H+ antiporter subunit E [Clostridium tetanomorphum]
MKAKSIFSTAIFSFILWLIYIGSYSISNIGEELIGGIIVSVFIGIFASSFFIKEDPFWILKKNRILWLLMFIPSYTLELVKANWDVAKRALSPKINVNPGIVKIETDLKSDYGLAMLANCITLTPGTITMNIIEKNDKVYMYVHWIDVKTKEEKAASQIIKGTFEPWIRRIFK